MAMKYANRMSWELQVKRCGFITLTQSHRNTPIVGRQRMNGSDPNRNRVRATSFISL
jgi:hypothetical protein